MTVNMNEMVETSFQPAVESHPAWHGKITGLEAEDRLKGHKPHTYLVRDGEVPGHYYASSMREDGTIRHQPFCVHSTNHGWFCRNLITQGPFIRQTIDDVIHSVIHSNKEDVSPLLP
jgi:hypothetical protein